MGRMVHKRHRALPNGREAENERRLADLLANGPGTVMELSKRWGLAPRGVRQWLEAREWLTVEWVAETRCWRRRVTR
jgi:hypothetical protein